VNIKEISPENRPRERFIKYGPSSLSDAEILAVILGKGTRKENAIDVSNKLISRYGLEKLSELSLFELQRIRGIGPAKAVQIAAGFELYKRAKKPKNNFISCAKDVFDLFSIRLRTEKQEKFIAILLDTKNFIISEEIISVGTLDAAIIHPREIFRPAIKNSCSKLIILHNHPSGDPSPSDEDLKITERIVDAGRLIDIHVLDHIIIGDTYWSWHESVRR
jgi:DNA repair protein RadC